MDYAIRNNRFFNLDINKMLDVLDLETVDTLGEAILNRDLTLESIIRSKNIDIESSSLYSLDVIAPNISREVRPFIKDSALDVYIPGSSLKGTIRTAILTREIDQNDDLKNKIEDCIRSEIHNFPYSQLKRLKKKIGQNIENMILRASKKPSPYNDALKFLKIADAKYGSANKVLLLTTASVHSYNGYEIRVKRGKNSSIEVLKPKKGAASFIIIEKSLEKYNQDETAKNMPLLAKKLSIDTIIKSCKHVSQLIIEEEKNFADRSGLHDISKFYSKMLNSKLNDNESFVRLGWGSGYIATTVMLPFFNTVFFDNLRDRFNLGYPDMIFPKSRRLVIYNGVPYPLGWMKLKIIEKAI